MAKEEEKVNQPEGAPIAPEGNPVAVSRETLSHQWQKDSPAINTNAASAYPSESIMDKVDSKENLKKREDEAEAALKQQEDALAGDYDCSELDTSDNRYCHKGSPRHVAYLDAHKIKHDYK